MRLKSIRVRNFRLIEDLRVELDPQTAILGGNGCGKSTLLRAMDRFYGQQTTMSADDFFGKDLTRAIEIELTFKDFNQQESELFKSRIHNGGMTVTRVFEADGGKGNGRYYGSTLRHPGFDVIRSAEGRAKTAEYSKLRNGGGIYADLPSVTRIDQLSEALEGWERDRPELCELARDDGQFFGFTNVAKGALQRATNFVFVPAVRDAAVDSIDAKGSVIARLMELVVKSAIQKRQDIKAFQEKVSSEFRAITDPAQLPELNRLAVLLSDTLKRFYDEAAVALEWKEVDDFVIPLPAADVFLEDDGFRGPVDRKGHGLQRAFILTLLQHLAGASVSLEDESASPDSHVSGDEGSQALQGAITAMQREMPGLILAIEEPELYQHPIKQRHFARVLGELSAGRIPGAAGTTQVIFASHSPLFVSMERFQEIRIARRIDSSKDGLKTCNIRSASLSAVARSLERAQRAAENSYNATTLAARLHILGPELAEGFFANLVVLVEGVSDRAAILATASLAQIDFESLGVAVLPVGGKTNLDRPTLIFSEFEIPTYLIWDCDSGDSSEREKSISVNRSLQRICEVEEVDIKDFFTLAGDDYSCFEDKLETTLKDEIGAEFQGILDAVKSDYGISKNKDALKTPIITSRLLNEAASRGFRCKTLESIVGRIVEMRSREGRQ
jgi:putative ATP-dependent endonuclease of the OLD family